MPLEIFNHIEGYTFQELLGRGGFGAVCKAIDKLGREVAIKALTLTDQEGPDRETSNKSFLKEATTLAKLNHPNIVTIYSFDIDSSGQPYLVMEFLPGEPLSKIIRSGRQLHLVEKLSIILQAARALQFAHNVKPQPVIHRDIKPHNLMVMPDNTVKLIDFGIAQVGGMKSRSMNNIAGSLPYMSPEHWQLPLTPWGDVFSLGVVFYELLTGTVPYATEQDTVPVAYQKIVSNTPAPPLKQYLPDVPAGLEEVMAKVLSKQKANGYKDAQQFWLDLSKIFSSVKAQFLAEGLERAIAAKNAGDYETAGELAQKLLRIDPENHDAGVLQSEINQDFQRKERSVKVRAICERVEEALQSKKFDLAQLGLEEALQLDPGSQTVALLNQRLRLARDLYAKIEALIANAEKLKQSGHWNDASQLVAEALTLDRSNTLALNLRSRIDEMKADEHRLCQEARAALDQLRFQEAFQFIRQAESLTPNSERVRALKEYAITVHQQQAARQEVEAISRKVQGLYEAGDLAGARLELQHASAKYPDQKRLLGLRDAVELKLANLQRDQFVQEQCVAAERERAGGNPEAALARVEEALLRFPDDARLRDAAEQARRFLADQAADKQRTLYRKRVRESLRTGNASGAIITLEMALAEFAGDRDLQMLLPQARAMAATQAGDHGAAVEILTQAQASFPSSEEIARLLRAARDEDAGAQRASGPESVHKLPTAGPSLQTGKNRPARETHPNPPQKARPAIERAQAAERAQNYAEAIREWKRVRQLYPKYPGLEDRLARLAADLEKTTPAQAPVIASSASHDVSATMMMKMGAAVQTPPPGTVAAPKTLPQPSLATETTAQRGAVSRSRKLLPLIGVAAIILVSLAALLVLRSAPKTVIQFEIAPPGTLASVNGQRCISPCSLKLKPGKYTLEATHDGGYSPVRKEISVASHPETVTFTLEPPKPDIGNITVEANLDQVDVLVDGLMKGITGGGKVTLPLLQGRHKVAVKKPGYDAPEQSVDIAKDGEIKVQFTLKATGEAIQAVRDPFLLVRSSPGATVQVDHRDVGVVPADGNYSIQVKPGRRVIALTLPGYEPWSTKVTAKPGDSLPINAKLKEAPKPSPAIVSSSASPANAKPGQPVETVPVSAPLPKPVIDSFLAGSETIFQGQSTKLVWDTQGGSDGTRSISPEIGFVPAKGSREVKPDKTTTYSLTVTNGGGSVTESVLITVTPAPSQPAPVPVVTARSAPTPDPDIQAVKDTLGRFKDAYESLDVNEVGKVMSLSKEARAEMEKVFKDKDTRGIKLRDHDCSEPVIRGNSAEYACKETLTYITENERQPPINRSVVYELQKLNGAWRILKIKAK
jgi:serine/threonine protein kinase